MLDKRRYRKSEMNKLRSNSKEEGEGGRMSREQRTESGEVVR